MNLTKRNMFKIVLLVLVSIILFGLVQNYKVVLELLKKLIKVFLPFIIGGSIAFILNVPMSFFEKRLFISRKPGKKEINLKIKRTLCIIISAIIVFGIVATFFSLAVGEIGNSISTVIKEIPKFMNNLSEKINGIGQRFNLSGKLLDRIDINWDKVSKKLLDFMKNDSGEVINKTIGVTADVVGVTVSTIIGIFFSIYVLYSKEKLGSQIKRLAYSLLKKERADKIFEILSLSSDIFSRFFVGQCCEALILGLLCYFGMLIFKMPNAALISSVIGVTALIPVFGAFIGIIFGAFIILLVSPVKAFWFIVFVIILQQIEGNLIYPKVVGKSVGLPGIWVLFSVTVGGGLFGAAGLLISVPVCSVIYCLLKRYTEKKNPQIPEQKAEE